MSTTHVHPVFAQAVSYLLLLHMPAMVFLFCFGACVGSFVNVVIYRLPAGMSVISPPSRCPTCGAKLRFFRENLPILGWFFVRGRCRYCGDRVSPQYMIIELVMALLFIGLYAAFYMTSSRMAWWGQVGGPWWWSNSFWTTWPVFLAHAFLIAGLLAMTIIDARTYTIPLQIPVFITFTAFAAYVVQSLLPLRTPQRLPLPCADWPWVLAAIGGIIGIAFGVWLLKSGRLRYSFADYHEYLEEDQVLGDYPHARREMVREVLFLAPCIILFLLGYFMGTVWSPATMPRVVEALGASFLGYLCGAALVWGVRILGTLLFGREAMGLGDVHLLAAIGAVVGWFDPILIFFIAPFSGLLWHVASKGLASVITAARRELPYGPHLAVATLVVILCRPGINSLWTRWFPTIPMPQACGTPVWQRPGAAPPPAPAAPRPSSPRRVP